MKKYTTPENEFSYSTQYPDLSEFKKPFGSSMYVHQGHGDLSLTGQPLGSDGFGKCFGLIVRNRSNLESALFHIDDWHLNERQTPIFGDLIKNFIRGMNLDVGEIDTLSHTIDAATSYWNNPSKMSKEDFMRRMVEVNKDGLMQARFIYGDVSRQGGEIVDRELLGFLGIKVIKDIFVNTDNYHWDTLYLPEKEKILVNSRHLKKVFTYSFE